MIIYLVLNIVIVLLFVNYGQIEYWYRSNCFYFVFCQTWILSKWFLYMQWLGVYSVFIFDIKMCSLVLYRSSPTGRKVAFPVATSMQDFCRTHVFQLSYSSPPTILDQTYDVVLYISCTTGLIMCTCTFPYPFLMWSLPDPVVLHAMWSLPFPVQQDMSCGHTHVLTHSWCDPCQTL